MTIISRFKARCTKGPTALTGFARLEQRYGHPKRSPHEEGGVDRDNTEIPHCHGVALGQGVGHPEELNIGNDRVADFRADDRRPVTTDGSAIEPQRSLGSSPPISSP